MGWQVALTCLLFLVCVQAARNRGGGLSYGRPSSVSSKVLTKVTPKYNHGIVRTSPKQNGNVGGSVAGAASQYNYGYKSVPATGAKTGPDMPLQPQVGPIQSQMPAYPQVNGAWTSGLKAPAGNVKPPKGIGKSTGGMGMPLMAGAAGGLAMGALAGAALGHKKPKNKFKIKFDSDEDSDELLDSGLGWYDPRYYQNQRIVNAQNQWPLQDELDETPLTSSTTDASSTTTSTESPASNVNGEEQAVDEIKSTLTQRSHPNYNTYLNKETVDIPSIERAKAIQANLLASNQEASHGAFSSENINQRGQTSFGDVWFVAIVAGCSMAAIFGVIGAGYCVYKFNQQNRAAADVDYPAYGVVGPVTKDGLPGSGPPPPGALSSPSGDRKLAQSAQMYHYHHQKQQMIASETRASHGTSRHTSASDVESDDENEDGDYTVYECPGLASTGEMEVKNPLFQDDMTPMEINDQRMKKATSKRDVVDLK